MCKALQSVVCLVCMTGCAGSSLDVNFRRRVDHVACPIGLSYAPPFNITLGITPTIYYRNPDMAPTIVPLKTLTGNLSPK